MKIVVLYRPESEFARSVDEFLRDLHRVHGINDQRLQVVNYDSQEGIEMAGTYGIVAHPAILITSDDGSYIKHWEGSDLPLQEEVTGYLYSASDT